MKIQIGCVAVMLTLVMFCGRAALALQGQDKPLQPNVLWLCAEDIGPHLACYEDRTAKTPRLDALAAQGLTYDLAWSNYPVCAPARTTIITGMYAGTLGAGNMRSLARLPANVKMFPQYLREVGYYCANNGKEDYNLVTPEGVWDRSGKDADWRKRKPGQPFFAVINYGGTHEGKIRNRPHKAIVDPTSVALAPYWPDVAEVRQDWAQYYDNLQPMDEWIANQLQKLEDAGEADNTIVFFFGDHGCGMPRHKRFVGDSGMSVPFVIHVPEKLRADFAPQDYRPGGRSARPIGFVDLAPSILSVAGIEPPDYMQGRAFLGRRQTEPSEYVFGFRERMDERPDLSYSVRDHQFIYVRNFMPHLPAGQHLQYQMKSPATAKWFEMYEAGKLNSLQSSFWQPRSGEELYDLRVDPFETKNLAGDPQHQATLEKFRIALKKNTLQIRDLGFVHEGRLQMITSAGKQTRRDFALDPVSYPLEEIYEIANAVGRQEQDSSGNLLGLAKCVKAAEAKHPVVRYWAAMGVLNAGKSAVQQHGDLLKRWLDDKAPEVALTAAEAIIKFDTDAATIAKAKQVVINYCDLNNSNSFFALTAINIVDRHWQAFATEESTIMSLPTEDPSIDRGGGYIERMLDSFKLRKSK